ncbi:tRNA lysidine(34) synthetase TilS [Bauldia litoralis]|uniref:tRNA lysidine(34) synthetase TilS n=1 Tax=Bauldia litoralis TaxID=665467 RepID=UPI003262F30B
MRAAEANQPLTDAEVEALLDPVAGAEVIALAVSGGADSLALLDVVDRWRRRSGRPEAIVLTVDHGLRPESAGEAADVAKTAEQRGFAARVLTAAGPAPTSDIEAAARDLRYRLLVREARESGASHLLLAHHRDDQAETFLMRLQRGSGVFGLAAMRRCVTSDGMAVFRPFLDIPHTRLVATTAAAGLVPVDDPMNRDPRFLRARVRMDMPRLAENGMDSKVLADLARRFANAADAIDSWVDRLISAVSVDQLATARVELVDFAAETEEVRLRLLVRLLAAIGGEGYPPRFQRLEGLDAALREGGRCKRTLGGVVAETRGKSAYFYRESGRDGLPEIPIADGGFSGVWDGRYRVRTGPDGGRALTLAALGEAGRRAIQARIASVPAAVLDVQPALWRGGDVVAAPTLGFIAEGDNVPDITVDQIVGERLATPSRFPRYAD